MTPIVFKDAASSPCRIARRASQSLERRSSRGVGCRSSSFVAPHGGAPSGLASWLRALQSLEGLGSRQRAPAPPLDLRISTRRGACRAPLCCASHRRVADPPRAAHHPRCHQLCSRRGDGSRREGLYHRGGGCAVPGRVQGARREGVRGRWEGARVAAAEAAQRGVVGGGAACAVEGEDCSGQVSVQL